MQKMPGGCAQAEKRAAGGNTTQAKDGEKHKERRGE